MKDEEKSKAQLIDELVSLRQQVAELNTSVAGRKQGEETLRESEERFRTIFESAPIGICLVNEEGKALQANRAFQEIFGSTEDELRNKTFLDYTHPDDVEESLKLFQTLLTGENDTLQIERRYYTQDGHLIWAQVTVSTVRDAKGKFQYLVTMIENVTERKRVEEALRESEERYWDLINGSPNSIIVVQNKRFVFANSAGARMFGFSKPEQLEGRYGPDMIAPAYYELVVECMKNVAAGKDNPPLEMELLKADGTTLSIESTSVPIMLQGEPAALIIGQDITERKRAEEALRESEHKFRSVVELSHDGIAVVDEQGIVAEWNQAMEQCTGLKAEEVLGRPIWDVQFHMNPEEQRTPEAYEQFKAGLLAFLKTGQAPWANHVLERAYRHPDGTSRVIQGTIYSIKTDKGFILVSSARDVTDHRQAEKALRESEERYRRLVESSDDLIFSVDRNGVFKTAGGARLREFGLKPADVVNRSLYDLFPEEEARHYQERHEQVFESGTGMTYEHSFEFAGLTKTDLTTLYPIKDERGQIELVGGICRDITKRKQAEEALRERERFLQDIFDGIQNGISVLDPNLNITQVNKWIERMYHDEMPLIGKKCYDVYQKRKSPCPWCPSTKTLSSGKVHVEEVRVPYPDGSFWWCELSAYPLKDANSKIIGVIEHVKDITRRKQAEKALRESQRLLEMTFTSLRDAVFILDADTVEIVDCNPAASQIFGYSREEMLGRATTFLHIDEAALEEFRSHLYPALEKKGFLSLFEFKMKRKDGTIFPTEHSVVPLKDEQDKRVGWVSVVRDITNRKRAEEQIQASLHEKEALLREVHHRVKNNLQVVCALLDLQADAVENERVRTAFQESRNRIRSMAQIHEQLTHAENLAQIDMAAYVQELVASLRVAHGTDAAAIKIDVSGVTLPFDAVSPCGLLINELVSNALKHAFPSRPPSGPSVETGGKVAREGNEIRITLRPLPEDENKMDLSVSDNGVGLPADVDLENPTSLGLILVNLLTRQLNATLEVERETGTTFKVVFAP